MPRFNGIPIEKTGGRFGGEPISTITTKPLQTSDERIQQSREGWKTAAPIIGDVGMTMLAPQLKGPFMAGKLAMPAMKAINLLMRMGGAAAGAGGGSVVGQKMAGDEVDMGEAGKQALVGGGGEAGLTGAGQLLKIGGKYIGKPALELATGMTPFAKKLERRVAKSVRSGQKAMMESETDAAEKFIYDIAPDVVKKQDVPINDLDLKVAGARQETSLVYDKYEAAIDAYAKKNSGIVHMDDTAQLLNDLREGATGSRLAQDNAVFKQFGLGISQREELKVLLRDAEGLSPKSIKYILATMNKNYKKLSPTKQAMLDKLKGAMLDDIGRAAGAKDLKVEADTLFKETKRFLDIKKLFNKGKWVDRSGRHYIQPYSIAKEIYANQKKILDPKFGSPELWPKLKALADHYFEIYPQFQKIEVDDAFDLVKAWQTMSPKAQKVLSVLSGVGKQTAKAGGKAALHLAGEEIDF